MSAIREFETARQAACEAASWYALLGKEYFGGTCGKGGEYGHFSSGKVTVSGLCIYHQAYDGAANYHTAPIALCDAIGQVLKTTKEGRAVIVLALQYLNKLSSDSAGKARKEHEQLMIAAGIPINTQPT